MTSISEYVAPVTNLIMGIGDELYKGTLWVGEGTAQVMYDVFDIKNEGLEKWVKFNISLVQTVAIGLGHGNRYNLMINDFESLKDILYATKIFVSIKDLSQKGIRPFNRLNIKNCLYAVANALDTLKFLKKQEVFDMQIASDVASYIGSISLSSLHIDSIPMIGEWLDWKTVADVPVINSLTRTPKDLPIFIASTIEVCQIFCDLCYIEGEDVDKAAEKRFEFVKENIFKFLSSLGKMVLIALGKYYQVDWYAIVALVTNGSSFIQYNRKCAATRQKLLENPAAAAVA